MEDKTKRILLFLIGCMGARFGLVWLAYRYPAILRIMGYLALIPAIGFMYIYVNGLRQTGVEVLGGRIWWNDLRPVHSALYAIFAYLAINNVHDQAWKILLADVLIGLGAFTYHHTTT
jgi:hypothetical protein